MKYKRHNHIIKIVKNSKIHTHDELIAALQAEGFKVTQATVSRDIKELGLVKVPSNEGSSVYSVPEPVSDGGARPDMVSESIKSINSALHTIVINTYPGMASAVAAAVDRVMRSEILGSIAGDDTVLIITRSEESAEELKKKLITEFRMD
ncbi:MAG: arginine repressor [Clostridia bacterium]|nr:arginine repressor [Clostridia bacterium]